MNSKYSNLLVLRNLQEQVKNAFCYQKLFWPFTVWINCSSDLKNFENSQSSAWNFKSFSPLKYFSSTNDCPHFFFCQFYCNERWKVLYFLQGTFVWKFWVADRQTWDFQQIGQWLMYILARADFANTILRWKSQNISA